VRGTTRDLAQILDDAEPDEVIIAIPRPRASCAGASSPPVVSAGSRSHAATVFELLAGSVNVARAVRDVQVEDVLGREPVHMALGQVGATWRGRW